MAVTILQIEVLLGSGVAAGVLFAVALSVLPALFAMPAGQYVETHRLIGKHWDPTMPIIVMGTTVVDFILAVVADDPAQRILYALAGLLLAGVSTVSHLCNVPINRRSKVGDNPGMLTRKQRTGSAESREYFVGDEQHIVRCGESA